ncbi:hypothetical protein GWK36_06730 [Caldichromatium japonicum]|uniref:Uncharacterized protein n=2 Tax=Caldichromatium japonicum TaxID=2699430 RepID=A0A6G7VCI6_9GAMM|nr:hypothetical protein GWK36_06730 [Caldichromatium japonicum]
MWKIIHYHAQLVILGLAPSPLSLGPDHRPRAHDLEQAARLRAASTIHAYPGLIESSLQLGTAALRLVGVATIALEQLL